jgi:thiamine biosynthesis lipoprotein
LSLDALFATSSWDAIGTTAIVQVADPAALETAEAVLVRELARIDRAASSYRMDSDLAHLNASAGGVVAVSEALHEAVAAALSAAEASSGLVEPTLGADPGWHEIELLGWAIRLPAGVMLDLGATAKALAADRAAAAIARATGGSGVLVSLGGDIAVAGETPDAGWHIHVTDDHRSGANAPGQTVRVDAGAIATSGTTVRRGPGGLGHHIIDPRTGRSAEGRWRTASVTAGTCVDANTASTAAIILGDDAPEWLGEHGLAARLVSYEGRVLTVGGWPEGTAMPALAGAGAGTGSMGGAGTGSMGGAGNDGAPR